MPEQTETMTPAEALLWLAELEKKCPLVEGAMSLPFCESHCMCEHHKPWRCEVCHGTGKVPVLPDLREPCPYPMPHSRGNDAHANCQGRSWLPKQGRDALYDAMLKVGWYYEIHQDKERFVLFYRSTQRSGITGEDADEWLAAVKAMKAAGYLG